MLGFFRKYQKYVFIVITVVIIISFSFFGTYNTLSRNDRVDRVAFTAINGKEIKRHELEQMALFLGTDNEDKLLFGGVWGPNFLNDGVIKKDLLDTGMAQILVKSYLTELRTDLETRFQKEKKYTPYANPQAGFLSAVNVWNAIAPQINTNLAELQSVQDPASPEAFDIRVRLFSAQRQFPQPALRQVLRLQQRQYSWIPADPQFERTDFSIFGYHTLSDWFGPAFMRLAAEFVINSSMIAEQQGYVVSHEEALADLSRNAEISFQQNVNNPNMGVPTAQDYFNEQLRRLGMDQSQAVGIWRQVLLFRRLFHDLGNSVFIDPFTVEQFQNYAKQTVEGELYELPINLRMGDFSTLQKFEMYLNAVSKRESGEKILDLPKTFKTEEKIAEKYPELVQRRFLLEYAKVDKRMLQVNVGVKDTWNWEVKDNNWEKLKKEFPELAMKEGATADLRFQALDSLDPKTRTQVDAFSRAQIVNEHPEWIQVALNEAPKEKRVVGIRKKGDNKVFAGLKKPQELIDLLDKYPESKEKLEAYTPDGMVYYSVVVLDRSPKLEALTFGEANKEGVLDSILNDYLEKQYQALKEKNGSEFKNKEGQWKPFAQVRNIVATKAFGNVLDAIKKSHPSAQLAEGVSKEMNNDYTSSYRLYAYMNQLREEFKKDPKAIEASIDNQPNSEGEETLLTSVPLNAQWKILRTPYEADRGSKNLLVEIDQVFEMKPKEWSNVYVRPSGNIAFLQLSEARQGEDKQGLYEASFQIQNTVSLEVQRALMRQLTQEMENKNALSLHYLRPQEQEEGE